MYDALAIRMRSEKKKKFINENVYCALKINKRLNNQEKMVKITIILKSIQ